MATPARLAGVGVFVLGGLLLFTIGLFMIGDRQMAFARSFTIYTEFAKITGLQPGAIIRVSGAKAGSVKDIAVPLTPAGKFRVKMEIAEHLHPLVRTDSVASIRSSTRRCWRSGSTVKTLIRVTTSFSGLIVVIGSTSSNIRVLIFVILSGS